MITITINNSYSQLLGLTSQQANGLKKVLSYSQDNYFTKSQYNTTKYLIDNKGSFPTGLLSNALKYLHEQGITYTTKDLRVKPKPLSKPRTLNNVILGPTAAIREKNHITPHKFQLDALQAAIRCHQGILVAPTGCGKSLIVALLIHSINVRTLIIVPNIEIKKQLINTLTSHFNTLDHIKVCNIDASELINAKDYDCLIIDESHHSAAKTYQTLNKKAWSGIYYRFFLTATPFRNNEEESLLFQAITGKIIYQLTYQQALLQKLIVPIEAYYIDVPKTITDAYTWAQVYSELVVNNKPRNTIIANMLKSLTEAKVATLCLVKEIAHGTLLSDQSQAPFVNGQDDDTRQYIDKFNRGAIKALIGTSGVIGEGIDTKPCQYIIIAGLGKAKSAFMQQVGRCVRTAPGKEVATVIIFRDVSHKFTLRHFKEQCKILKQEYNVIPTKLDI